MRNDAVTLEDGRLDGLDFDNYPWIHERHRIFPEVLLDKKPRKIIDISAGIGVVGKRIADGYDGELLCNEISPKGLQSLKKLGLNTTSFDLDDPNQEFPFDDGTFDAIISLATIEHIINLDHHLKQIRRILKDTGHLYISAPNHSGLQFYIPYMLKGESFHNPLGNDLQRYEFYAHVRYFTYKTLLRFVSSFGFRPLEVYLPLPKESARYRRMQSKSRLVAGSFRSAMRCAYTLMSPRWALHPVLCFAKADEQSNGSYAKPRKVVI